MPKCLASVSLKNPSHVWFGFSTRQSWCEVPRLSHDSEDVDGHEEEHADPDHRLHRDQKGLKEVTIRVIKVRTRVDFASCM